MLSEMSIMSIPSAGKASAGKCSSMNMRTPLLSDLANGLLLVTVRCSCNYFAEIFAFDEILIRMRLSELTQNRITMTFDYARRDGAGEQIVARGEQQIACMRRDSQRSVPVPVPSVLREALLPYMHTDSDR
jgi:enediyne core biosynthesis thioesterase